MSKRKSQTAVSDYIAEGFIREALVNYLALLGWATGTEEEVLSIDEIVERFELTDVHKGGAVFDRERLEWLNGQWIRRLEPDDLIERLRPFVAAELAAGRIDWMPGDDELRALLPVISERLPKLDAIGELVGFLWVDDLQFDPALLVPSAGTRRRRARPRRRARDDRRAPRPSSFEADELEPPLRALAEARGWKVGDLFMAIRVAVTGRTATPPLFDTLVALGQTGRSSRSIGRSSDSRDEDQGGPDDPRRCPGLARPLHRGLDVVRPRGDRGAVRATTPSTATSRGRTRSSVARRSSPTGCPNKDEPGVVGRPLRRVGLRRRAGRCRRAEPVHDPDGSFKTLYYNHFQLRFDGHGKCVEFIEFFMELPGAAARGPLIRPPEIGRESPVNTRRYPERQMARTILVVDDEPALREALVEALESDGFRVVSAADGREALVRFRADRPDLVLLDLMLPELSGIEVCRIIRAESSVPIVMLTAKDSELDKVVGLELGADDYVTKPFSLRELTARIRALFRRSDQAVAVDAAPAVVDLGPVQADLGGRRLLRDGEVVPLKPKAFELLAFLIRHPGQVFTRDQLLEHVWGYDYGGETRTVDVHIHWLRSRIEADPADPAFIHTVRGVGYVFRRPT